MAVRTRLLNWNNIARDTDFSKYIETVSEPWVIEWLTVTATKVAIWKCWVPCERANGETIYALVYNSSEASISGNGDVYIEVSQAYIDNWELANEDWTGIATINVGTLPSKNALLLATITNGVVTDQRNMIRKVGELNTLIKSLNTRMNTVEAEIDQIKEDKAVDHLEETGLVWELYTLSNTLFKQHTPTLANSTLDANVWDTDANKQIHIQRLASGTASNQLKLKVKKVWAPTTWLVVEVRRWIQVDVSSTEAYWYWDEVVATGSIPYSWITTDYQEFTVNLNWQFWGTKWEKLDIVVYQTWNIVNSTNYYAIACDSTQYSEWFSFVAVNGTTRTRSKLMPYCIADGFAQSLLCKTETAGSGTSVMQSFSVQSNKDISSHNTWEVSYTTTQTYTKMYIVVSWTLDNEGYHWNEWANILVKVWGVTKLNRSIAKNESWSETIEVPNISTWTVIQTTITSPTGWWNAGAYRCHTIRWTISYSASQSGIVRPLIATEIKAIWQQGTWMSYWRKSDWTRYWDYDATIHNSATTGSITLWNCLGFKVITDSNWEKYKVPIYWM